MCIYREKMTKFIERYNTEEVDKKYYDGNSINDEGIVLYLRNILMIYPGTVKCFRRMIARECDVIVPVHIFEKNYVYKKDDQREEPYEDI